MIVMVGQRTLDGFNSL